MADAAANYIFLPWVRQGAAAGIQIPDRSANQPGVVSVSVQLEINNEPDPVKHDVRLYGPGDVTGIDQQQVVRTEPRNLSMDFEPNYFAAIEFDRPDFPWLLTPAKADAKGILRPWLCLVVVRERDGVKLTTGADLTLPVLEIKSPAEELPDLSESWAWAHVQVAGSSSDPTALENALAGNPALTVSRLLCPRRLDPLTRYIACVVPTFELGRKAGLGEPIRRDDQVNEENQLKPAWETGAGTVRLPVYYHWQFKTGTSGDFEALVGLLKPADLRDIPNIGKRDVDISHAFGNFVVVPQGTTLELEGALRVPHSPAVEWSTTTKTPFQTELKRILDEPWLLTQEDKNKDPIVAPPIYGCWQAARHTVNITVVPPASLTWLDELNLDPRHRAVAAIGTQVIQTQQEQLMASAWEQLGEIQRINQMRRQAQLGRAVNAVYYTKSFKRFSPETLLKVTATAQARLVIQDARTKTRALLSKRITDSVMPDRAVSAPLRRMSSPRNAINTRFAAAAGVKPVSIVARLSSPQTLTALRVTDVAVVKFNDIALQVPPATLTLNEVARFERALTALEPPPKFGNDFTIIPEGQVRTLLDFQSGATVDGKDAATFRATAKELHTYLQKVFAPPKTAAALAPAMDLKEISESVLRSVNPETTIKTRVQASLVLPPDTTKTDDPIEPIMDSPKFPQPMYEALRDISQDFLFPGLERVPTNTVTLLEPNPKFVESFLVGLNAEMAHELLWRNYPTDQRGTYFHQFWDTEDAKDEDIAAITEWRDRKLGDNSPNSSGALVLLIRGELLRRYPNTVIYAVPAVPKDGKLTLSTDTTKERHPLFRGTLKPDVTFIGFKLSDAEALGEPPNDANGWFFVIQQQPTEPRFGMDEADFEKPKSPPKPQTWNDLSWRHLAPTEADLKKLSHATVAALTKQFPGIDQEKIDNAKWGKNSAHQAYITLQRPVRIAIHARDIIKRT
jgi:hypothetical protein